jgi:hypothetical protein
LKSLEPKKSRHELWHRGSLNWKLRPEQQRIEDKFLEIQKRGGQFFFVNCSRRNGKTVWAAKKGIETALKCKNPRPRVKVGSAFYEDLVEFTIPSHDLILEDCPQSIQPTYVKSSKKYRFGKKKAEIKLAGLDLKPNGLRGNWADLIILEEAGFMKRLGYQYESICLPMGMYRPGFMIVMIGTPPETPDHEWVSFQQKAILDDAYIELTIDDNTVLSQEEKNKFLDACLTDAARQREYYCKVVVDASRAITPEFSTDLIQEVKRDQFFPYYHRYDAMDLGVADQTVCLFGYYDFKRGALIVEDELMMQGPEMTTDALASSIWKKEKALWSQKEEKVYRRVADNDNPLLLQDMVSKHGLGFAPTRKDSLHAMVNEVRIWLKDKRIIVHPRCKLLIGCLKTGIWDDKRKAFMRSAVYGHYDALAALIYMVRNVNVHTNPIPATHKMTRATHFIHKDLEKDASIRKLRKGLLRSNK